MINYQENDSSEHTGLLEPRIRDKAPPKVLNIWQMIGFTFFCVSGGPYAIEDLFGAAPPLLVYLSFFFMPWIWSFPLALLTAELSSAIPCDGGTVMWIERAFGPFVGWTNAFCSWAVFILDSTLYPVLFVSYLSPYMDMGLKLRWLIGGGVIVFIILLNMYGIEAVGWGAIFMSVLALVPFIVLVGIGFYRQNFLGCVHEWKRVDSIKDTDFGTLITLMIWNASGWDDIGAIAGEVKNPSKNFARAMAGSILVDIVTNMLPLLVGFCVDPNRDNWVVGHFADVVQMLGGQWFLIVFTVGALVSNVGLLNSGLCSSSRVVYWMAKRGWLPHFLGKLSGKKEIPRLAVIFNGAIMIVLVGLPFDFLVQFDVWLMSSSYALLFLSYLCLRIREPRLRRPFKLPGSGWSGLIYVAVPIGLCLFQMATVTLFIMAGGLAVVLTSMLSYVIFVKYHTHFKKKAPDEVFAIN